MAMHGRYSVESHYTRPWAHDSSKSALFERFLPFVAAIHVSEVESKPALSAP